MEKLSNACMLSRQEIINICDLVNYETVSVAVSFEATQWPQSCIVSGLPECTVNQAVNQSRLLRSSAASWLREGYPGRSGFPLV
jgi:hypothetical protein